MGTAIPHVSRLLRVLVLLLRYTHTTCVAAHATTAVCTSKLGLIMHRAVCLGHCIQLDGMVIWSGPSLMLAAVLSLVVSGGEYGLHGLGCLSAGLGM
jgi:hypothetical protein